MNIYERYQKLLEEKKQIDAAILDHQVQLYNLHKEQLDRKEVGTVNVLDNINGYKLTVVKRENVKVDQDLASVVGIAFTKKYSLNKKVYDSLPADEKRRVDECLTVTPGKPSFKVEKINGN